MHCIASESVGMVSNLFPERSQKLNKPSLHPAKINSHILNGDATIQAMESKYKSVSIPAKHPDIANKQNLWGNDHIEGK